MTTRGVAVCLTRAIYKVSRQNCRTLFGGPAGRCKMILEKDQIKKVKQVLLVSGGRGWYQEEGKPAQALKAGDVVVSLAGVKHWHGAAADS